MAAPDSKDKAAWCFVVFSLLLIIVSLITGIFMGISGYKESVLNSCAEQQVFTVNERYFRCVEFETIPQRIKRLM